MTNKNRKNNLIPIIKKIIIYSICFTLVISSIIYIFHHYNKSFIWNNADGTKQHIITLSYFKYVLTNFFKTGNFSTYTWKIANGIDMYGNLAYYILGDIFSYISFLFPSNNLENLYDVLVITRIYFIGISFLCYTNYKKNKIIPSVIGALFYTFSTFSLFSSVRHPYFANALIIFPLTMLGIEKIILENKKIFYIFIIAITYISNFYFAYMISFIIAIYGIILTIYHYKKSGILKILKVLSKVLICSIVGILISGIILIPSLTSFIFSERTTTNHIYPYTLNYYSKLITNILSLNSAGYWVYSGIGQSIILLTLPVFIKRRKENIPLFVTLLILCLPLLSSKIASLFCGFGFPNNRWTFIISFIFSFITTSILSNSKKLSIQEINYIIITILIYLSSLIIFKESIEKYTIIQFTLLILLIFIFLNKNKLVTKKVYSIILLSFSTFSLILTTIFFYSPQGNNYVKEFLKKGELENTINTSFNTIEDFDESINFIKKLDNTFYKISKNPYNYENVSLIKDFNSIGHFYSLTPRENSELNLDLANSSYRISLGSKEFDYRTKIATLLGNKYYISGKSENIIPYGYTKLEEYNGQSDIYINNYFLPFGILYTSYITEEDYEKLNSLEKESSLLKNVILNDNIDSTKMIKNNNTFQIKEVDYQIKDNDQKIKQNKIEINSIKKNKIILNIDKTQNSELYIYFENLKYFPYSKKEKINQEIINKTDSNEIQNIKNKYNRYESDYSYDLKITYNQNKTTKKIYNYIDNPYYIDTNDFLFNLGFMEESKNELIFSLSKEGVYTYDNIKIYTVSFKDYQKDIDNLRKSNFVITNYEDNLISGKADIKENGVLQFQTMYNKGMKVYVDGKLVKTFKSNKYFIGINITKGKHKITLKYQNPYIKIGLITTIIGSIIFLLIIAKELKINIIKNNYLLSI